MENLLRFCAVASKPKKFIRCNMCSPEREMLVYRCPDCKRILQYQGGGYFYCIYRKDYFDFDVVIKKMECKHLRVIIYWKLYARETRFEPAEYIGKAQC